MRGSGVLVGGRVVVVVAGASMWGWVDEGDGGW